jgi:hypothetical protein
MKAKLLNLEEALQMYELISKFLDDPKDISQFPKTIGGKNYVKCLELLTGEDKEVILHATSRDRLLVFTDGFMLNRLDFLPRLKMDGLNGQ